MGFSSLGMNMATRLAVSLLMALLLSMALSCSKSAEKALVEEAIKGYNSALVEAYRDAELSYMDPYATAEQLERLKAVISPLRHEKHRMQIVQESFAVESVTFKDGQAEVVTQESWTFWNEDRESLEAITPKETDSYRIIYTLKKQDGKWLIDRLSNA